MADYKMYEMKKHDVNNIVYSIAEENVTHEAELRNMSASVNDTVRHKVYHSNLTQKHLVIVKSEALKLLNLHSTKLRYSKNLGIS